MSNTYSFEYTDTLAGDANYAWVKRGTVTMPEITHYGYTGSTDGSYARANRTFERELVKRVKARIGLTGVRCNRETWGETIVLRPRGTATVVFIDYAEG